MTEPTARELLDGIGDLYPVEGMLPALPEILAARVERVLALHKVVHTEAFDSAGNPVKHKRCNSCRDIWPCPTVRLLDGADE